ncbi:MAG: hypothetical protein OHK0039_04860 [Bacteroidia bacterium]
MHEDYLYRIIHQKLSTWEVPPDPEAWEHMLARLEAAFDQTLREKLGPLTLPLAPQAWEELVPTLDAAFDAQVRDLLQDASVAEQPLAWPLLAAMLEDQPLDTQAAASLHSLELPYDATDWLALETQLDEASLDTALRHALADHQLPLAPNAWEEMTDHLDAAFDTAIRHHLDALETAGTTSDWPQMAAALDTHPLDTQVRERLEAHQLTPAPGDWEDMLSLLEAPFDQAVRHKLHDLQVRYRRSAWEQMRAYMGEGQTRYLPRYATAAAIILLLLGFGWIQLGRQQPDARRWTAWYPSGQDRTPYLSTVPVPSPPKQAAPDTTLLPETRRATPRVRPLPSQGIAQLPIDESSELAADLGTPSLASYEAPSAPSLRPLNDQAFARNLANPYLQGRGIDLLDPMARRAAPVLFLGLTGGMNGTRAELNAPDKGPGYTTGLRLEMQIDDNWSVISGISYSLKQFSHNYPVIQDDKSAWGRLEGELRQVEVPLLVRYRYPLSRIWAVYTQAGIVTTVSLVEDYLDFSPNDPVNAAASRLSDPQTLTPQPHTWNLNTYPSNVHAALGVQYELNDIIRLQAESYFQQSLQRTKGSASLGFQKRLYTTGIQVGMVFRLTQPPKP